MLNFKNIPNFLDLADNNQAYYADNEYTSAMQSLLNAKHDDNSSRVQVQPLTFLSSMINSMSSLYTEDFYRDIKNKDTIDEESYDTAMVYVERYYNLHRRSAIFTATDEQKHLTFKALDPSRYFIQGTFSFISTGEESCTMYIEEPARLAIYDIAMPLSEAVEQYNLELGPLEQYSLKEGIITEREAVENGITKSPLTEVTYYNNDQASLNSLVLLQKSYISDISWGVYAGSIKLITQPVLDSDKRIEDVGAMLDGFGTSTSIIQVGKGEKLSMYEAGDIKILLDLFEMYKEIITQSAIQNGADITAITAINESGSESATAKMVKLNYINKARKNHTMVFKAFEAKLWSNVKDGFNIDVGFNSISFPNLKINETEAEKLSYNERLYNLGLINFQALYAATFGTTYEMAAELIAKYGLNEASENEDENTNF